MTEVPTIYLLAQHSDLVQPGGVTFLEFYYANETYGDIAQKFDFSRVTSCNMSHQNLYEFLAIVGKCYSMQFLFLAGNKIKSVGRVAIFPQLIKLDLSNNYLTSLGFRTFWEHIPYLKFLYLSGNRLENLQDLDVMRDLQHLSVLTLFLNPLATFPRYHKAILDLFPHLDVLDNIRLTPTDRIGNIDFYAAKSKYYHYACGDVTLFKQEYDSPEVYAVLYRFNATLDSASMINANLTDYHDVFCVRDFNLYAAAIECRRILRYHDSCPLTIIQNACRVRLARIRLQRYETKQPSAAVVIQKYARTYSVYERVHQQIMRTLHYKKRGAKTILAALLARKSVRLVEYYRLGSLKLKYNAAKIVKALRRRKMRRYETNFEMIAQEFEKCPEALNLFVAKTYDTEQLAYKFMRSLCDFIRDEISSSLLGNPYSELWAYKTCEVQCNATRFCMLSAAHPSVCKQVFAQSIRQKLASMRVQEYDIESFIQHRRLSRALRASTWQLKQSCFYQAAEAIRTLGAVAGASEEQQHDLSNGSGKPYYFHFRIVQKEIAALFKYALQELQGVRWPGTAQYSALLQYGSFIFNKLLAAGLKHQLVQLFQESLIPMSLFSKQHVNSRLHIAMPLTIRTISAAVTIYKIVRAFRANAELCDNYSHYMRQQFFRVHEIILLQRAARVIYKQFRGVLARQRVLIFGKMRDVFTSALIHGFFLISESALARIRQRATPSRWLRALHVNYSAPVTQLQAHQLFHEADVQGMNVHLVNTHEWRQFASIVTPQANLFSAFNGQLFGTASRANFAYIQLNSAFLKDSPLTAHALSAWVRHAVDTNERDFEFFGVALQSSRKVQQSFDDFIDLEAIKAMCGLRRSAESTAELDRLLDLFQLAVDIQPMDYAQTVVNIFANVEIADFSLQILPKHLHKVADRFSRDMKIVRLAHGPLLHKADIACKALLLELLFCDPGVFATKTRSFIARKWLFAATSGPTTSVYAFSAKLAAIYIQKYGRGYIATKRYKYLPRKSSLLKKINTLFKEENYAQQTLIEYAYREVAAINLLKCAYKISQHAVGGDYPFFKSAELFICPAPVYAADNRGTAARNKRASASEIRYYTCIYSAAKDAFQKKLQAENRLKIETVHDLTSHQMESNAKDKLLPKKLILKLYSVISKEIQQPALSDQIRTSRLQNKQILVPLTCQSPKHSHIYISKSEPGSRHESAERARGPTLTQPATVRGYVEYNDLRYFSAYMQRRYLKDQVRANATEMTSRKNQDCDVFYQRLEQHYHEKAERQRAEQKTIMCLAEKRRLEVVRSQMRLRSRQNASSQLSYCRGLHNEK